MEDDRTARVRVVDGREGTFTNFVGYDEETPTDASDKHDDWGADVGQDMAASRDQDGYPPLVLSENR